MRLPQSSAARLPVGIGVLTAMALPSSVRAAEPVLAGETLATSVAWTTIALGAGTLVVALVALHRYSLRGMQRQPVDRRLALGFAGVLAVLVALVVESYTSLHRAKQDFTTYRSDARHTNLVASLDADYLEMRIALRDLGLLKDESAHARYAARQAGFLARITEGKTSLHDPALNDRLDQLAKQLQAHAATEAELLRLTREGTPESVLALLKQFAAADEQFETGIASLRTEVLGRQNRDVPRIAAHFARTQSSVLWLGLAAVALGAALAWIIGRSIVKPLAEIARHLGAGAEQTSGAAAQVSSSSQSLAHGASEQASSIEETSASLEELASMTKRNAESSGAAKQNVVATQTDVTAGALQIEALQKAMAGIKEASEDITKILKTIDEIAFQTNLLALNAAVEAARAGEHGAGFAIVANEVRALAQRASESARETSLKVEHSVAQSRQGAQVSQTVAENFATIQKRIQELDRLATEIATASNEQNQGLAQLTQAVATIDQVTQANAGTAEQTAAAAEELSSQAAMLRQAVGQLQDMAGAPRTPVDGTRSSHPISARLNPSRPALAPVRPTAATTI